MAATDPAHRARALARRPRAALSRAPPVARPARGARRVPGPPLRPRPAPPLRGHGRARAAARAGRASRSSCPTAAPTPCRSAASAGSTIPFPEGARTLSVFWMAGYAGGLFIPFRDAHERHRDIRRRALPRRCAPRARTSAATRRPARSIVDFNFAFQPSCAFDPRWACPLAPPENRLDVAIRAGERLA